MYPNLKLQMWRSGIRQNRLAKMLEMDETILSKIVNGFRHPNEQTRARIAQFLQSDEKWLFEPAHQSTEAPPLADAAGAGNPVPGK